MRRAKEDSTLSFLFAVVKRLEIKVYNRTIECAYHALKLATKLEQTRLFDSWRLKLASRFNARSTRK